MAPDRSQSGSPAHPKNPSLTRRATAWVLTVAFGALAGPVLGEYQFTTVFAVAAGLLAGLLFGEVCAGVGRVRDVAGGVVTVFAAAGGMLLAGWYASSRGLDPYPSGAWLAAALAAVAAWLRAGPLISRRSR